jgi:hypothetical protein
VRPVIQQRKPVPQRKRSLLVTASRTAAPGLVLPAPLYSPARAISRAMTNLSRGGPLFSLRNNCWGGDTQGKACATEFPGLESITIVLRDKLAVAISCRYQDDGCWEGHTLLKRDRHTSAAS